MEIISNRLSDFFHKTQEEMVCLLKKKYLKKKQQEIKKRKDDLRKNCQLMLEQDIKKQNAKFCGREEVPSIQNIPESSFVCKYFLTHLSSHVNR